MWWFVSLTAAARAPEAEPVAAAAIAALPMSYDGGRVRTEVSLLSKLSPRTTRSLGCGRGDVGFMLDPGVEGDKAPGLLRGTWILCADAEVTTTLAQLLVDTGLVLEATLDVSGPEAAPRIQLSEVSLIETRAPRDP